MRKFSTNPHEFDKRALKNQDITMNQNSKKVQLENKKPHNEKIDLLVQSTILQELQNKMSKLFLQLPPSNHKSKQKYQVTKYQYQDSNLSNEIINKIW